ncbi:hypothetical protein B0H21DRAFT_765747 [Amylocystis lapponica]|nr:hypothetical protein B0H21DRAFT_765747 [Amylocystis lapponica]
MTGLLLTECYALSRLIYTTLNPAAPSFSIVRTMASSSSSSASSPPYRSVQSDVFRPKFPLDPFAPASPNSRLSFRDPWFLRVDNLQSATAYSPRLVIFILGAPALKDLAPILQSGHLSNSLVILATHQPPEVPHILIPTLRILRLSSPLAIEDSGAVRFVNVLEWAERVARLWRKIGGSGILELSEDDGGQSQLSPPPLLRAHSTPSPPASPSGSPPSRAPSFLRARQDTSGVLHKQRHGVLPAVDPSQRPFDALVNFLPESVSDKALLKQTILVTTISRPFLAASAFPSHAADVGRSRRRSIFTSLSSSSNSSNSSVYLPVTPAFDSSDVLTAPAPPVKARLVHLLPPTSSAFTPKARTRLIETVEPFLLSFTGSNAVEAPPPEALDRVRAYILSAATFASALQSTPSGTNAGLSAETSEPEWGQWAISDAVLSGALDGTPTATRRRAWIAGPADIVLLPALENRPVAPAAPFPIIATSAPASPIPITITPPPETHAPLLSPRRLQKQREAHAPPSAPAPTPSSAPVSPRAPAFAFSGGTRRHTSYSAPYRKSPLYGPEGLPTPPDSDESAEEGARRASEGTEQMSKVLPVGAAVGIAASATLTKSGNVRWRFWRK